MSARATASRSVRAARQCPGRAAVRAGASRTAVHSGPVNRRTMLSAAVSGAVLAVKPAWASDADAARCFIDVAVDGEEYGRLVVRLLDPSTVAAQRFGDLCKGIEGVGYRRSKFDGIFEVCIQLVPRVVRHPVTCEGLHKHKHSMPFNADTDNRSIMLCACVVPGCLFSPSELLLA